MSERLSPRHIEGVPLEPKFKELVQAQVLQPLPAVNVRNVVTSLNRDLQNVFDLALDRSSPLGIQVAVGKQRRTPDRIVFGRTLHFRSALVTSEAEIYQQDVRFPYVDAKGIGYIDEEERRRFYPEKQASEQFLITRRSVKRANEVAGEDDRIGGILNFEDARSECYSIRQLESIDVRTVPFIARIRIHRANNPNLLLRAWVTPFRLEEVEFDSDDHAFPLEIERKRTIVLTALEDLRENDPSFPKDIDDSKEGIKNYLRWLAYEVGRNVGIMHRHGWSHRNLGTLHNITLDARLVDAEGLQDSSYYERERELSNILDRDSSFSEYILKGIPALFGLQIDSAKLLRTAQNTYQKAVVGKS